MESPNHCLFLSPERPLGKAVACPYFDCLVLADTANGKEVNRLQRLPDDFNHCTVTLPRQNTITQSLEASPE